MSMIVPVQKAFKSPMEVAKKAISVADLAISTKLKYWSVLEDFNAQGFQLTDADDLAEFAKSLSHSRRAQLKAAVRLWSESEIGEFKSMADPSNVNEVQAAIWRFEALQKAIKVKARPGQKVHTWLTPAEVKKLLSLPGDDLIGWRDRLAMGLLVVAGMRRQEAVNLTFKDVKHQPVKGKIRTVLQIHGKGARGRVVPVRDRLAAAIESWGAEVGGQGYVLRSFDQRGEIHPSLSAVGLFQIVRGYGQKIGKEKLAPHDLRRSYAQIGYDAGVPITQISKLLGHSSVATTQKYLNLDLDLETTVSDFVPF
jgi:integrase